MYLDNLFVWMKQLCFDIIKIVFLISVFAWLPFMKELSKCCVHVLWSKFKKISRNKFIVINPDRRDKLDI